jgi:hypothetical protein
MKATVYALGPAPLPAVTETWTQDISAKGLFLEFADPPALGSRIHLTLSLPAELVSKPVLLECVARVVRTVRNEQKIGVGAVIERYSFVPAERIPQVGRIA